MYTVLLTGGLASGKDTVSAYLAEHGAIVLDADRIAKEAQEEEPVLSQLKEEFGDDIIFRDGSIDRRLLAERAFASPERAAKLNDICWPPVKERLADYLLANSCQPMMHSALLVVQIPLLVEAPDLLDLADEVIAVVADEGLRLERAVGRGMSAEDARRRLDLQAGDDERCAIADTVFDNNGTVEQLTVQVQAWYSERCLDQQRLVL